MSKSILRRSVHSACGLLFLCMGLMVLAGCGGGDESTDIAQAPTAPPPSSPPGRPSGGEGDNEDYGSGGYGSESYGSEDYSADSGGGRSGGRTLGAGDGGGGGSMDDYYAQQMAASGYGGGSYGGEPDEDMDAMYGSGYPGGGGYPGGSDMVGMGGPGMGSAGMGSSGMGSMGMAGGTGAAAIGNVVPFVRQNCLACHGPRQTKGGIRLDSLSPNLEDPQNVELYQMIAKVLEDGSMPPPEGRPVDPAQREQMVALINETLESSGVLDRSYLEQAEYAYSVGREQQAVDMVLAHGIVAEGDEASEFFSQVQWFNAGTKPTTTVRFAVGAILEASSNVEDLKPIGSSQMGGGGGGGGMYGGGMGRPGSRGGSDSDNAARSFNELTGEFGSAMVAAFESRKSSGAFGSIFKDVVAKQADQQGAGGMGRGFGGGRGMGSPGMGGPGGYGGDTYGDAYSGYPGGNGGEGDDSGYGAYGDSGGGGGSDVEVAALRDNIRPGEIITPGLVFVGTGTQAELLERAELEGVDGLFVFDIEATQNPRRNIVNNKTRLRVVKIDGNAVAATKSLTNTEVERARMREQDDGLQKNIDRFFTMFDEEFALAPLPPIKAEHAMNRVRQLLAQREALPEDEESSMDLQVLFESKLFHHQGLVSDEDLATVFQIVLEGNEGISLATGSEADRKLVLGDLLASKG